MELNLEQINLDVEKEAILLNHSDLPKNNLAQGKFNGKWYFGKLLDNKGKKINAVIFQDGTTLMNISDLKKDGLNEFDKVGFRYSLPLLPLNNSWGIESILDFIKIKTGKDTALTTYPTHTTQTTQITQENEKSAVCVVSYTNKPHDFLIKQLNDTQEHYMDLHDPRIFSFISCYIISTYCFELFKSLGYLFLYSDSGSGKTKYANLIGYCSFNTTSATSPSESVLFRIASQAKGLLVVDDYENIGEDNRKAIDQILKVGYKKGGVVPRTEKIGDKFMPVFFDVYCPKIITNTIGLDNILYSRCIPLHLLKTNTTKGKIQENEQDKVWQRIRNEIYWFVMENWKEIESIYKNLDVKELNNRDLELVKPLLAIAEFFGKEYYSTILDLSKEIFSEKDIVDSSEDWEYNLFNGIRERLIENCINDRFHPKDLAKMIIVKLEIDESSKSKPSAKWVGRCMMKIPSHLYLKKRENAGVVYIWSLENIEILLKTKGWLNGEKISSV